MARVWSILTLVLACLLMVSTARAEDEAPAKKKHDRQTPDQRFDALEKAVKHDPLTGVLAKDEYVTAVKATYPKMADKAEEFFKKIPKADENKVTKEEYVKYWKERYPGGKGHGKKKKEEKKEST